MCIYVHIGIIDDISMISHGRDHHRMSRATNHKIGISKKNRVEHDPICQRACSPKGKCYIGVWGAPHGPRNSRIQ